ncbi:signal transduction histidine kinase [Caulobacter ginsengisoli]|uniref:histidine kinase n=1 Tax=Caulobacter ginsengisoli TaxID=400775 RepID=A0ABU0IWZ7_9CAUL|nr:ATP-binding protein [Caulobacter ginsengisoli]MDQ0465900.1 signal transduction histidine kinase [Caulobacter ginsengisoli]
MTSRDIASSSPETKQPPARRRIIGSFAARLNLLVAVMVVTSGVALALLSVDAARSHRATNERQLAGVARALSLASDGEVAKMEAMARTLAASPYLQLGELRAFELQARKVTGAPMAWIVLVDPSGRQLVNTLAAPGAPLPGRAKPDFAARWTRLQTQDRVISNLATGRLHKGPILAVDVLVRRNGKPAYDLAVITTPAAMQEILDRQDLPKGWYGGLIDGEARLIARNIDPLPNIGRLASPDMRERLKTAREGVFEGVSLDGRKVLSAFHTSSVTGWTMGVAMPRSEGAGYLDRSLRLALLAVAGLMLAGVVTAVLLASAANRAMAQLTQAARGVGDGGPVAFRPSGVSEIDAVGTALAEASSRLTARETELRELNETLEARVQEASEKLIQAQKLEAMGRLVGGVAHDFNNLLTAVLGNIDMLRRRLTEPKLIRYADRAQEAAERGARLTGQLLAFARKQRLKPQPVDVAQALGAMSDLLSGALGGQVALTMTFPEGLSAAQADPTQLELIVLNLAINARDAMDNGGQLQITAARRTVTQHGAPESPPPGDFVVISVTDTGAGMSPDVRARAFEPFFTTKEIGRGSGLGLSQILGVVQQLGGGVEIETGAGGTRVDVFLPVAEHGAAAPKTAPTPDAAPLKGLRLLLVDDDDQVRVAAAGQLEELGLTVHSAASGEAALAWLDEGGGIDLALLDFAMPGLNGVETARRIAERRPNAPITLMSGFAEAETLASLWTGRLVSKPFTVAELILALTAGLKVES